MRRLSSSKAPDCTAQVRHRRQVAEVALRQPKPVALLTSDSDDMTKLCGKQVRIIPL